MAGTQRARELAKRQAAQAQAAPDQAGQPTVQDLLEKLQPQIARALPKTMTADRFARIVMTTLRTSPQLMTADPQSLMAAVMLSAQLGLEPGPLGHAYLVPYKREVTFIIGYKGIIDLARRSGEIRSIEAREVREGDLFEYEFGLEPKLRHIPADGDRGEATHFYGVAHFKDGGHYFEVLPVSEIERYRKRSAAGNRGPWQTDYAAMAKKTVIRRMAPYLPLSTEAAQAIDADEGVVSDLPSDDEPVRVRHEEMLVVDTTRDIGEEPEPEPEVEGEVEQGTLEEDES
jgi:recombination protein RecT